ncbi:MAG: leucine--tRNA ligase [Flavobacteriaceae bacterium]|nr:leucine--tRNA ligase [Flavobacteriaceae bacterium]
MKYFHNEIEEKWQKYWAKNQTFKTYNTSDKPKYYVLDMFPYPSGAGLHVGHPLGYIASDIYARYKRHKGFNVLHPQGYDSFGLPAEQYAIQTGQHPAKTTEVNIATYRKQLDRIGFSFDWSRELRTSSPDFYKYTQWFFTELFNAYYCNIDNKAVPIKELIKELERHGNKKVNSPCNEDTPQITASNWKNFSEIEKQTFLLKYRMTYLSETTVNWCAELGTVLANDEIVNGVSERGGHPVIQKKMKQWSMRITAYAQRLLDDLETIDWPQPIKDIQTNWIGRSQGAHLQFNIQHSTFNIAVFTTRPDTIFGVSFITLAPEHELVSKITTLAQKKEVETYIKSTLKRSERDRMSDVKTVSGCFTGAYAEHPFTKKPIPIYIGDYVLASYGTGAVMAVPCGDQRDYDFAKYFNIEIPNIFEGIDISEQAFEGKGNTKITNSDFLTGLPYKKAFKTVIYELEKQGIGYQKINYRLRDAVFSRQRYWGEPFPVYYKNGMPQMIAKKHLPILLPKVENYLPTSDGKPPLGNANTWAWDSKRCSVVNVQLVDGKTVFSLELNTMPGWAGSSWYFNRYMDAHNSKDFAAAEALNYWQDVDLYIGGSEHATGHLLYARFWQKFLYDLQLVPKKEFAKKLINQGMILGESAFVYRLVYTGQFISKNIFKKILSNQNLTLKEEELKSSNWNDSLKGLMYQSIHIDVSFINTSNELDIEIFKKSRKEYNNAVFILEDNKYIVGREVEKMSKSKYNVVNPDLICKEYGADALRLFEMFLGPLEQSKPWKTAGISGVYSFLKKLWRLYNIDENGIVQVREDSPSKASLKTLHKTIQKVEDDISNFSFNTSVSTFMIAVNELTQQKCNHRKILEPLLILLSPYAPHITEELWSKLGHITSISTVTYPIFDASYLVESNKTYPISFNGKMRFTLDLSLDLSKEEIEKAVMTDERTQKQLDGRTPKKVIVIPGKIVNIVG